MKTKQVSPILQELSRGGFIDQVKTPHGIKAYNVVVFTVRLTPQALSDFMKSEITEESDFFNSAEEYEEYKTSKEEARADICKDIAEALGIKYKGITVTQNVSEIFTVTQIFELE